MNHTGSDGERDQSNRVDGAQGAAQELMADLLDFNPDNDNWTAEEVFDIVVLWASRHGVDTDGGIL
jgi:hypothetical protein